MVAFQAPDSDAQILADIRELLYIIAMAGVGPPETPSGRAWANFHYMRVES